MSTGVFSPNMQGTHVDAVFLLGVKPKTRVKMLGVKPPLVSQKVYTDSA